MRITIKYFAIIRETLGRGEETRDVPESTTAGDLLDQIGADAPNVARMLPALMIMVNQEYATRGQVLQDGDELALIPPVSGGAETQWFRVQAEPIDPREVENLVTGPAVGGIVTFSGAVRDHARGKTVVALDYEAYAPAAVKMLSRIGDEVRDRWQIDQIAIVHRTGLLKVGEVSVVISASSAHRAEAFAACSYAIDRIKEIVPIWKKELYEDGSHWVGTEAEYQQEVKGTASTDA